VIFARPQRLNEALLAEELEAQGYREVAFSRDEESGEWGVLALTPTGGRIDERSRSSIEAVLAAHTGSGQSAVQRARDRLAALIPQARQGPLTPQQTQQAIADLIVVWR
jgi:hypothetical protein